MASSMLPPRALCGRASSEYPHQCLHPQSHMVRPIAWGGTKRGMWARQHAAVMPRVGGLGMGRQGWQLVGLVRFVSFLQAALFPRRPVPLSPAHNSNRPSACCEWWRQCTCESRSAAATANALACVCETERQGLRRWGCGGCKRGQRYHTVDLGGVSMTATHPTKTLPQYYHGSFMSGKALLPAQQGGQASPAGMASCP